jgi:hypothetical protein
MLEAGDSSYRFVEYLPKKYLVVSEMQRTGVSGRVRGLGWWGAMQR